MPRIGLILLAAMACMLVTGCASRGKAPRCKGSYVPINAPAHYLKPGTRT
jgi:hypothetical protein